MKPAHGVCYRPRTGPLESPALWLGWSTAPVARAYRDFLNANIPALPEGYREVLYNALRSRWRSALHELFVARTLQVMGATLTVEAANPNGTRPDFVAEFPDGAVTVEAVSPIYNASVGRDLAAWAPLQDHIERQTPDGWIIWAHTLPAIPQHEPHGEFKRVANRMLRGVGDLGEDTAEIVLSSTPEESETLGGAIELHLVRSEEPQSRPATGGPASAYFDNAVTTLRKTVKRPRKRKQARGSEFPVLLAVDMPDGQTTVSTEKFDRALYGDRVSSGGWGGVPMREWFDPVGEWTRRAHGGQPAFAGVMAFLGVECTGGQPPVLYPHPRFEGTLPDAILALAERRYDPEGPGIVSREARRAGPMDDIAWMEWPGRVIST